MNQPVLKTWIFIADGAEAKLFEYCGEKAALKKLSAVERETKLSQDLVENKRGRTFNSAGPGRSAMENPTDPHDYQKHVFAKEMANYLNKHSADFERLVLAAAPKTLGEFRTMLSSEVQEKISDTIDKDLTNIPENELASHFEDILLIDPNPRRLASNVRYAKP